MTVFSSPLLLMSDIVDTFYSKQSKNDLWQDSIYKDINKLKLDYVGKVGEKYIVNLCKLLDIEYKYDEDINAKDGTYDILISGYKIETKTARMGLCRSFQHEGLRNSGSDFYMFLDIAPKCIYLTILPKFDLDTKCSVMGRKPHLRKGTSDVFKFDFSVKNIDRSIQKGFSIKIDNNTHPSDIATFMTKKLSQKLCINA